MIHWGPPSEPDDPSGPLTLEPAGFFLLRTPLLPFDDWLRCHEPAASVETLDGRIRAALEDPIAREALWLSSPSLASAAVSRPVLPAHVSASLSRYFARMVARPTPYGLMAGVTLGDVGAETEIHLAATGTHRRRCALDVSVLHQIARRLESEERPDLVVVLNSTAYRDPTGCVLRYLSRAGDEVELDVDEAMRVLVELAAEERPCAELAGALAVAIGCGPTEAMAYVVELVRADLLVAASPKMTGPGGLADLTGSPAAPGDAVIGAARRMVELQDASDGTPLGDPPAYLAARDEGLAGVLGVEEASLLHVDLVKVASRCTLGPRALREIGRGAEALLRWGADCRVHSLTQFKRRFLERYGETWQPLTDVLDPVRGIQLLDLEDAATALAARASDELLELVASGQPEVEVPADPGTDARGVWPASVAALVSIWAPGGAAVDGGEALYVLRAVSGPGVARLVSRFSRSLPRLERLLAEHVALDDACDPDAIHAEVVYTPSWPTPRAANVCRRPALRDHEIPYGGVASVPVARRIAVEDLLVAVVDGEVHLWSRRLDRPVAPHLSTAHAYAYSTHPQIYRFLVSLQDERLPLLRWGWGNLEQLDHLPRVRCGRAVLSPRTWNLAGTHLRPLLETAPDDLGDAVRRLRETHDLPRYVSLSVRSPGLPLDLESPVSRRELARTVKRHGAVRLAELPSPDQLWVTGPEGRFVHEMVVPFRNAGAGPRRRRHPPRQKAEPAAPWRTVDLTCARCEAIDVLPALFGETGPLGDGAAGLSAAYFVIGPDSRSCQVRMEWSGEAAAVERALAAVLERLGPRLETSRSWLVRVEATPRCCRPTWEPARRTAYLAAATADSRCVAGLLQRLDRSQLPDAQLLVGIASLDRLVRELLDEGGQRLALAAERRLRAHEVEAAGLERRLAAAYRSREAAILALLSGGPPDDALPACFVSFGERVQAMRRSSGRTPLCAGDVELAGILARQSLRRLALQRMPAHELGVVDGLIKARRRLAGAW